MPAGGKLASQPPSSCLTRGIILAAWARHASHAKCCRINDFGWARMLIPARLILLEQFANRAAVSEQSDGTAHIRGELGFGFDTDIFEE